MRLKAFGMALLLTVMVLLTAGAETVIPGWRVDSPCAAELTQWLTEIDWQGSPAYVPPEDRIAVFDFDGTLYGERFPTYFDHLLLMHRVLHDDSYEAPAETRAYVEALEAAEMNRKEAPKGDKSNAQYTAEVFAGMTVDAYRAYIRDFMAVPVAGFSGMTYGEGFFQPMVSLVRTLAEHHFRVYIISASERQCVRELIRGTLDPWIPPDRVIGSRFSLAATGQGDTDGRKYTYSMEDQVILTGNLLLKTEKMNKVTAIVEEIGQPPLLVFGNSSGDLSMGVYARQNGGKAFMLLCDDTERDYGSPDEAAKFKKSCDELGIQTVSMKDEFETIYGEGVLMVPSGEDAPEELLPAA